MRNILFVCCAALALAACRSNGDTLTGSGVAFSEADAAFIKKSGKTTVSGHAFWRDDKGGAINASGEMVHLVPITPYSRERFAILYRGRRSLPIGQVPKIAVDPLYTDYTRIVRAESSGRFEFENVAPGEYYLSSQVRYRDKDEFYTFRFAGFTSIKRTGNDGGVMFETVTVTGKEEKPIKIVLTNDR